MKLVLRFCFVLLPFFGNAQGIKWEKSLHAAFAKAKAENKVLFVEFYSPTCPHCKKLAPILNDPTVAGLYNGNFVNYALDVDSEEGRNFAKKANLEVYGIPYFLFFRGDGTLIHSREVSAEVASVLQPGKMVLERTYTAEFYPKRFASGERSENFLSHYAIFSRVKKDSMTNFKVVDALWSIYPVEKREASWNLFKKISTDTENGFARFWLQNHKKSNDTPENVKAQFTRLLHGTLFGPRKFENWDQLAAEYGPIVGQKEVDALLWEKRTEVAWKKGEDHKALQIAQNVSKQFDAGGLLYLCRVFNQKGKNPEAVQQWLKKVAASPTYNKVEYFYQNALLEKNRGNKDQAKVWVQKALTSAKATKASTTELERFLKEL